jgi:hypothetical protein
MKYLRFNHKIFSLDVRIWFEILEVSKKTEKPIKLRKPKKNNWKNRAVKKNRLKFWKNWPVWFKFYKSETEKTKKNQKKPSQTETKPS